MKNTNILYLKMGLHGRTQTLVSGAARDINPTHSPNSPLNPQVIV